MTTSEYRSAEPDLSKDICRALDEIEGEQEAWRKQRQAEAQRQDEFRIRAIVHIGKVLEERRQASSRNRILA